MAIRVKVIDDGQPFDIEGWLQHTDDKFLACRAQGHAFPKLRKGKLPKGMSAVRQHDGAFELIAVCRDCGTERRLNTLPKGELGFPARYRYAYPEGYKSPKRSGVTGRLALLELWRRTMEGMAVRGTLTDGEGSE